VHRYLIAGCVALAAASGMAQNLAEKIDVSLVNVDVTVTLHGAPARGLTADDFEVFEDGVPQTITHFYAIENAREKAVTAAPATVAVNSAPAPAPVDERFRRKVLLIVDYAHTSKINRNRALARLENFIDDRFTGGQYDWSIAVAGLDVKLVLPLTSDKARIHDCIEALRHDTTWKPSPDRPAVSLDVRLPFHDPYEGMKDWTYTATAFRAVRDAARAFAGAEGKKVILLLTAGFGAGMDDDVSQVAGLGAVASAVAAVSRQMMTLRDDLIREANASNLNFYIIDPEGVTRTGTAGALYWMARQTGGTFMGGNSPEQSLRQFDELSSNFYSLAFRPQHPEDFKYHRISVKLKRPGSYKLQYRDGYGSLPIEAQLERTLASPNASTMQASVIPLSVTQGEGRLKNGVVLLPVAISVPLKSIQFVPSRYGSDARVNLFVSVFDANGRNLGVQRFITNAHAKRDETMDHGELTQTATLRLTKGTGHTIVVAVHDEVTDAVGVAKQRIEF
jgi:VWFA-related protein